MLPDLDEMTPGFSLRMKYREFEQVGEVVRCLLIGMTSMVNQQGKEIPVAVFQNRREVFVNAGSNLVSQVQTLPLGTALEITYLGKEPTKSGNKVKTFEVRLLTRTATAQ